VIGPANSDGRAALGWSGPGPDRWAGPLSKRDSQFLYYQRTVHRTYWCIDCRLEFSVPVCWQKHRTALHNGLRFPDR